ncbi:Nuclear transport factor 2 [Nowakowskiella sp. JEL0407]|nr:Nuclear transport factor 2 [Nowakowskiella sp. JEL0407]
MADPAAIAKAFTEYYYQAFQTNRAQLGGLYKDISMMTFEGTQVLGTEKIVQKLTSLPFQQMSVKILTTDFQPSNPSVPNAMIVDPEPGKPPKPLFFCQTFQLIPDPASGSFWIYNDIFRLNYG